MGAIQPWHIILIVVVFLLLFGGKKLPDAARGLGRSLRILKSEVGAMHDDDAKPKDGVSETEATAAVPTAPSQIAPAPINQAPIAGPAVQVPGAAPVAAPTVAPVANAQPAPVVVPVSVPAPVINVPMNGQPH
jgi:sec-independent protein translocase protein TatA